MTWPDFSYFKGEFRYNYLKGYGCYTDTDSETYFGYVNILVLNLVFFSLSLGYQIVRDFL